MAKRADSYTFDLWSAIRYHGVDEATRDRIWNDGVHLNSDGYEMMGNIVAAHLLQLIQGLTTT